MVWTGCISAYDKMGSHPPVPCVEFSLPRCWAQFSTWSCITCIMMYPVICVRIDPWMTFFDHLNDLLITDYELASCIFLESKEILCISLCALHVVCSLFLHDVHSCMCKLLIYYFMICCYLLRNFDCWYFYHFSFCFYRMHQDLDGELPHITELKLQFSFALQHMVVGGKHAAIPSLHVQQHKKP